MAQFNSYINFLDLTAATDFCREKEMFLNNFIIKYQVTMIR